MPVVNGTYINPFYQQVDAATSAEMGARASYYGARVRGSGNDRTAKGVMWSYGKKPWARITGGGITLGTPGSPTMSDRNGNLTMYSAQRNVPKFPLLKSLELSNEGTMGSLLKGKFTFTIYPAISPTGFVLAGIEDAFFTPGKEVLVRWGWSVYASNSTSCTGRFVGIIYNFNWSVNPDLSITADVSIVSAATVATGMSGDQSTGNDPSATVVQVLGQPLVGPNLASTIDKDFADPAPWGALSSLARGVGAGPVGLGSPQRTASNLLSYYGIGLPFQATEPESESTDPNNTDTAQQKAQAPPPPVDKVFYYTKLADVTQFINNLITALEGAAGGTVGRLFRVCSLDNRTAHDTRIRSAYPIDVFFPDDIMGEYGTMIPFAAPNNFLRQFSSGPAGGPEINIGNILLGTDFVKETYKNFVAENSANIPYKNITSFFEEICKKINEASGDVYQLTATLYEDPTPTGNNLEQTIMSIEDSNLAQTQTSPVIPFAFGVNIWRPLIKNASISCKPPAASAAAAYTAARGEGGAQTPVNSDVQMTPGSLRAATQQQVVDPVLGAQKELDDKKNGAINAGFNKSWGEQYRGLVQKYKKFQTTTTTGTGGHWLNKAIYPIDLTLTFDGINGFKFGDTIQCFAIPARYNQPPWNVVFTVTKINHVIDDSKWETTLHTKARVAFGAP